MVALLAQWRTTVSALPSLPETGRPSSEGRVDGGSRRHFEVRHPDLVTPFTEEVHCHRRTGTPSVREICHCTISSCIHLPPLPLMDDRP